MRRLLIALFIVVGWAQATVVDGITIPASHPMLWLNASRKTTAQTWFATHPFTPSSTDYFSWAFHYQMSGTASDCTAAITWAVGYVMDLNAGGSDNVREKSEALMVTYDWCYDQWTGGQRSTFITNTNTWMDYYQTNLTTVPENNYFWGTLRALCEWGLISYNDQAGKATGYLDSCLTSRWTGTLVPTATGSGNAVGGVVQEGSHYGAYMAFYPIIPFVSANLYGRDVYSESQFFQGTALNLIYSMTQSTTYNHKHGTFGWEQWPFNDDESWSDGNSALFTTTHGIQLDGSSSYFGDFMNFAANYWSTINLGKDAKTWLNTTNWPLSYHLQAVDNSASITPRALSNLPLDYYNPGIEYFYGHSAWGTTGTTNFVWMLGQPHGVRHQHRDQGSWGMWRSGYWLSHNTPGYATKYTMWSNPQPWTANSSYPVGTFVLSPTKNGYGYEQMANTTCTSGGSSPTFPTAYYATVTDNTCTWRNESNEAQFDALSSNDLAAHNGVLLNGQGLESSNLAPDALPIVRRLESQTNYAYSDVDITGEYRDTTETGHASRDNPAAGHVEREFIFVRPLETLVILDRLTINAVSTIPATAIKHTFLAHCEQPWVLEDGTHERCDNGTQSLRVSSLLPTSITQRSVNEGSCPNSKAACDAIAGQYRLEIDGSGCATDYQLNVLQGRDSGAANLTASVVDSNPGCGSATTGTFTVTLHPSAGSDTTIVLNKGTTSSTGSINVAAGGSTNLITNVQGISISAQGEPVWAGSVPPVTLLTVTVAPTTPSVAVNGTLQFTATGHYDDSSTADLTATASWASSDVTKATINSNGLATPVALGTTTITATSGAISGNTVLTVAASSVTGGTSGVAGINGVGGIK